MGVLRSTVIKYPLTCFVVAAYALSWWSAPFAGGGLIPQGPFMAALLILGLTQGVSGIKGLIRRMTSWRGGWIWLVVAPGLVILYLLLAFGVNLVFGGAVSNTEHLGSMAPTILTLVLLGGWWEEPGWTGFALPLLQERRAGRPLGLLQASLIMGLIRAGWHLPLVISGAIPWFDAVLFSIAFQFLVTWLFNRTGESVLIPMLFHLTSNVVGGALVLPLFAGTDQDRFYILFVVFAWILALLLNWRDGWSMGRLRRMKHSSVPA
ncbi:MAG TPA: CPBP family intramembrane glutamic endopeptidase [Acidimicrobiia bacterium]|nr:CPBP family intramembrane glutamic endopeptidase [Acidimicrobiia bacterium]